VAKAAGFFLCSNHIFIDKKLTLYMIMSHKKAAAQCHAKKDLYIADPLRITPGFSKPWGKDYARKVISTLRK
jgi:hypothetical protein